MRDKHVTWLAWVLGITVILFPLGVLPADDKEKSDKGKKGSESRSADGAETKDTDEGKGEPAGKDEPDIKSGLRERRGYKQKLTEAIEKREEDKRRRREEWLADEKRRREAIKQVREELEAKRKQAFEEAKGETVAAAKPPPELPADQTTTILLQNGNTFQGVILGETDDDITLKIEGGELTIDKALIKKIRRPTPAVTPPAKK